MDTRMLSHGKTKAKLGEIIILLVGIVPSGLWARCTAPCRTLLPRDICRDMLLAYPMDRVAGMQVVDTSGGGLHGLLRGAILTEDEERGRVLTFTGQRDHLVVPDAQLHAFTFSVWVQSDTREIDNRVLMQLVEGENGISIQGNSRGGIGVVRDAGREINDYDWPMPAGVWTHVCVTYDGHTVTLYREGKFCHSAPLEGELPLAGLLTIGGSRHKQGRSWLGRIDDVLIVNRVLNGEDVVHLYRAGRDDLPTVPSVVAHDEYIIEAFIDDTSELHILPDLIYWTNNSEHAKPGRDRGRYEPTWINGRPWKPHWNRHKEAYGIDLSSQYGLTIEPAHYAPELVAVGKDRYATSVERGRIAAHREGETLIIRFEDWERGARWYRVRLYRWRYVDPVEQRQAPEFFVKSKSPKMVKFDGCETKAPEPSCTPPVVLPPVSDLPPQTPVVSASSFPVAEGAMIIDAYIDSVSDLWIKGDGLVWKNVTAAAKPGRGDGANEPTWINGTPWYPAWIEPEEDRGIDLSELRPHPLAPGFYQAKLLAVGGDRQHWSDGGAHIETIPLPESLVVRFDESGSPPRWYRILVTHKMDR